MKKWPLLVAVSVLVLSTVQATSIEMGQTATASPSKEQATNELFELLGSKSTPLTTTELDKVKKLIGEDADVNARRWQNQRAPIEIAVLLGDMAFAKLLLNNRANVNIKLNNDATPLLYAITRRDLKMVKLLVQYGADINPTYLNEGTSEEIKKFLREELDKKQKAH